MTDRILDFTEEPAHIKLRNNNLIVERKEKEPVSIHLPEVAALVAANRQVSFTQAALAGISANNGIVIVCDGKFLPVGMMLPLQGNSLQGERFVRQAGASLPVRKMIWKQIVTAKVIAQGRLLEKLHDHDHGVYSLSQKVRSGDSTGIEARAARKYWGALFTGSDFKRHREGEDQNRYLNYGYTILRAMVVRALCSAGLHPSLGVHHHNRYDTFCLADDVMEPFRPVVDRTAFELVHQRSREAPMDQELRAALIRPLLGKYDIEGEWRTLFDILTKTSTSLNEVFAGTRKDVALPRIA